MDANTCITNLELANAKAECRKRGIEVPKMYTFHYGKQYEVWTGKTLLGLFKAFNAAEAKAKYLISLIPNETDEPQSAAAQPQPDAQPQVPRKHLEQACDTLDAYAAELERVKAEHDKALRQEHAEQVRLINERDALKAQAIEDVSALADLHKANSALRNHLAAADRAFNEVTAHAEALAAAAADTVQQIRCNRASEASER